MTVVIMGVCGSGKTFVGMRLAQRLGVPFHDGDDFHPQANVEKMANKIPLTDEDREPWLRAMAREMPRWARDGGAVLACSALKERYRETLRESGVPFRLVYLRGSRELLTERLMQRKEHFMKSTMLDSQLAALEEPTDAVVVDISKDPESIVDDAMIAMGLPKGR